MNLFCIDPAGSVNENMCWNQNLEASTYPHNMLTFYDNASKKPWVGCDSPCIQTDPATTPEERASKPKGCL